MAGPYTHKLYFVSTYWHLAQLANNQGPLYVGASLYTHHVNTMYPLWAAACCCLVCGPHLNRLPNHHYWWYGCCAHNLITLAQITSFVAHFPPFCPFRPVLPILPILTSSVCVCDTTTLLLRETDKRQRAAIGRPIPKSCQSIYRTKY